jgi:ATP/ADP translocase
MKQSSDQISKKFVSLSIILFCILASNTILRDTIDTLIVNAGQVLLIPFLRGTAGLLALGLFFTLEEIAKLS